MKRLVEIKEIVKNITYKKGWKVNVYLDGETRPILQVVFLGEDEQTGVIEEQRSRKWFLSYHMTTTEIVYTALKAIQAAEEHETREFFKYKGVRIANPHFSVDNIIDMVKLNKLGEDSRIQSIN